MSGFVAVVKKLMIDILEPNEGEITRIEDDVFWGRFNSGQTFDMPVSVLDGHIVGTKVIINQREEDEEEDYDYSFLLIGEEHATIVLCSEHEDGMEIVSVVRVNRSELMGGETIH